MPDYGHDLQFGVFPRPLAGNGRGLFELARCADSLGLEHLGIKDHPYNGAFFDSWTLLAAVGATTTRIQMWPDVANLPLRPPVVLAKSAATLDLITGARVAVGLGSGAMWESIAAAGGPVRTPKESVDALVEAIGVMRGMWAGGSLRSLESTTRSPLSTQDPCRRTTSLSTSVPMARACSGSPERWLTAGSPRWATPALAT